MSYSIRNLREVEDMAPRFGYEERQEARFAWRDLDAEATGLAYFVVKPGKRQPFAHRHEQAEEIYVVLRGSGRIKLDDDVRDIREMDAIRIAPGVTRGLEADAEGLEILAFGPHHEGDGELVGDAEFWGG
jgi:mannose-6-phosphate isomerase-like protein (cupin superfamily)